jgi:atrial natriuretic peptide receptor A
MEKCWHEIPEERPSFHTIRGTIAGIMKYVCNEEAFSFYDRALLKRKLHFRGYCENLMDDLLRRMEQYANNLEALVEEKTEQLSLEKRRSEELLYQVLPR